MAEIEGAAAVREEDAFDLEAVRTWLAGHGVALVGDVEIQQFGGGASNLTYSLRTPEHDLILRRPPAGQKAKGAHDMGREYRIQSALQEPFGLVPEMVAFCEDESVIGSEFYVMRRLDGIIPRRDLPEGLDLDETRARALCTTFVDTLIKLHRVDTSLPEVAAMGKGTGYVERQIGGWSTRYRNAHTEDAPGFEKVMAWLAERMPADVANCVIHNDFRFDNVVLAADDPSTIIGVLDWEMATLGDPLMDLGGNLAYWVQPDDDEGFQLVRRQPSNVPGMMTRAEIVAYYCEQMADVIGRSSITPEEWKFYEVYGLFRFAVIAQQIYYRYFHGQTTNEMYALFGQAVHYYEDRCLRVIDGSI
ncbi:phosphotransferase family protein [Nocardioides marmoriginsengisoli]|uniref:Phosphotransferase family protein n=1 Tax=Nocardioides marmoriginsengisoli TaxID=661483 RepID=A0A3N0CC22_9ACTN|nr:phosphotransferase family protein [Nocardioides marmoriginsengisoli]RNL60849.1 phosphotransferase family protein [Nocardioides marmoriginsengisoli]